VGAGALHDSPGSGDVIITREISEGDRYSLRQLPGAPQASWTSREAAIDMARRFARIRALDVWLCQGECVDRILQYRISV
jgi:hypothetical protein